MAAHIPDLTLNNGNRFPILGFGTWAWEHSGEREQIEQAVYDAIQAGYRHIDTAWSYRVETQVGNAVRRAIEEGLVKREDMVIVTKVWPTHFRREKVLESANQSNRDLGLGYIDVLLLHFPTPVKCIVEPQDKPKGVGLKHVFPLNDDGSVALDEDCDLYNETWKTMEELVDSGITKSIGVSNFNCEQVETLMKLARIKPVTNQIESHPLLPQDKMIDLCKKLGLLVTAYSAFGGTAYPQADGTFKHVNQREKLFSSEIIKGLAEKYGKSVPQILLRFHIQRGVAVIPRSIKKERIVANTQVFDFELSDEDMEQLATLKSNERIVLIPGLENSKYYPYNDD